MGEAAQDSRAGEVLGSYTLIEVETSDGTCEAYRATDSRNSREVTVRVLRPEFALQSAVVQSFVSGPRTLSVLDHPNVSQVIAVESDDTGIPYVVEERVRGQLLSQMLEAFPDGMPLGVAMNVLPPIVEAVDAAHAQGIVHGCIDADHVMLAMVEGCSVPKVIGFGSADDGHCRAPEVIAGGGRDARGDIWSIGALFYQTLSGQPPQGATAEPGHVDLDEIAPHLPAALCSLVGQCLMRDPGSRVESDALSMQLGMLRQQLSGVGKAKSAVARKPDAATKRMPLRRDASVQIESIRQPPPMPPPPAARADEEPEAFDPFAKKASPSSAPPAADESPPGLPPMQAPPAMGASSPPPAARKRAKSSGKIDGLPSMRPPPVAEVEVAAGTKINTGIMDRIPTPLPPMAPPPFERAPTDPGVAIPAPQAPAAAPDDTETSFADISLDDDEPAAALAAHDESSFADISLDDFPAATPPARESSLVDSSLEPDERVDAAAAAAGAEVDAAFASLGLDEAMAGAPGPAASNAGLDETVADMGLDATMMGSVEDIVGAVDGDDEPMIEYDEDDVELEEVDEEDADEPEVKTLDALARAFGPLEGEDSVGQGETKAAKRARKFREDIGDETRPAVPEKFLEQGRKAKEEEEERKRVAAEARDKRKAKKGAALSRKDLRDGVRRESGQVTAEQLAALRSVSGSEDDSTTKAVIRALILLAFCFGLLFMMPLLVDPTRVKAYEVLGTRARFFGGGLSVLSVIALVQMWSLQLHASPPMIKPVTLTMKAVTACVCVCGISLFLPRGSLGPVEYGARMALPWAGGLFFLFLSIYGVMKSLRDAAHNALVAMLTGLLYAGALFGSYRVVMDTIVADIIAEREKKKAQEEGGEEGVSIYEKGSLDTEDMAAKVKGENRDATKGSQVNDRELVGADEESDMRAIEEMRKARKRSSEGALDVREKLPEMMR